MTVLIVVSGSMAAGKSTVSQVVVDRLRSRGLSVAFTALDDVADMARPTLPSWDWAHGIHAQLVGLWAATGIDVVVDEGTSSLDEVEQLLAALPAGVRRFHVVLHTSYEQALRRALADPTRGISKEPDFLRSQYEHFAVEVPRLPADFVIDVGDESPDALADRILQAVDAEIDPFAGSGDGP